jgi:hypothetical protein
MSLATTQYSVLRRPAEDPNEVTRRLGRFGRGSDAPPSEPPGSVHRQRFGEHELEVQRDGSLVTIALPGALRLRGRPDQIRELAAALLASLTR